jgi:hypothetical protein
MATTPNYGWVMPDPTDFVTSLPADFEIFGDAVDADLAGLLGGTTGQVLTKNSATDHDFSFATPLAGGMSQIATGSLTGSSVSLTSIPATFKDLMLVLDNVSLSSDGRVAYRINNLSASNSYSSTAVEGGNLLAGADNIQSNFWVFPIYALINTNTRAKIVLTFPNYLDANSFQTVTTSAGYLTADGLFASSGAGAHSGTAGAIDRIDIFATFNGAFTFDNGTYILYGVS